MVAFKDRPTLICVTRTAVNTVHRTRGMFNSCETARVRTAATVTRKLRANCTRWSRAHSEAIEMRRGGGGRAGPDFRDPPPPPEDEMAGAGTLISGLRPPVPPASVALSGIAASLKAAPMPGASDAGMLGVA